MPDPTIEPRWSCQRWSRSTKRWTEPELEDLKRELIRRARLEPLWLVCADAIGSLQSDLIDVG